MLRIHGIIGIAVQNLTERNDIFMADLRDDWKETGVGLGKAFKHLGQSIVKSAKKGINKADEWANGDEAEASDEEKKDQQ